MSTIPACCCFFSSFRPTELVLIRGESTRADSLQKVWRAQGEILCSGVLYLSYVHIHINQLGEHTGPSLRSSVVSGSSEPQLGSRR